MNPNDTISVLVCVHSQDKLHDDLLHRALTSLADQTYTDFDVHIVLDECHEYTERVINDFPSLKVYKHFREKKEGLAVAKNFGLSKIDSDLVAYLDADDSMMSCKLEVQLKYLEQHPEISVLSTEAWDYLDGILRPSCYRCGDYETHETIVAALSRGENPMVHGSCIIRTDHVKAVGGYRDIRGREDMDLYIRMVNAGYRLGKMPERLYYYSLGTGVSR
jgi:glycosyltransferase involved in cell wall biosynthesis